MGSLSSVVAPLAQVGSAIGSVASFAQPFMSASHKGSESDLALQNYQQNVELQKKQNLLGLQQAETERRNKLKKMVSSQRAEYGGSGVGSGAGSSEAVLQGLVEDSDIERQNNENDTSLANETLDQKLAQQRQLNLLQKQQLKQKTLLSSLSDLF
ncbi:MAG: hypothetical protein AUJ12_04365 [Alphaproteobacteria bacterium CG1_02_46_17]|nr:MAG: hypothetical protein AUJ12_04365 [Alphaproteobacteria bacterium CG1_02_46_17]